MIVRIFPCYTLIIGGVTVILILALSSSPQSMVSGFEPIMGGVMDHTKFRSSKWLPLIVIIGNAPCNSSDSHQIGTCYTKAQCRRAGGSPKGNCASGFGVCCVLVTSCAGIISKNNTYFTSREFPDSFRPNGHEVCSTKIIKPSSDICQVLLILHDMELVKGDKSNGHCLVDNINLLGITNADLPHLCGPLSKQHLYLEFGKSHITLSISMDGFLNADGRKWNVQVIYVACNYQFRAPQGCLQYYTNSRGSVKILGYPESPHLAGLQYTICIRKERGAQSVFWFPCRDVPFEKSFHFQGPNVHVTNFNLVWVSCIGDYITIMTDDTSNPRPNIPKDRYCGNRLTAYPPFYINSKATPYIIGVRTDFHENELEVNNTGFCLEWLQVIWEPTNAPGMPILFPEGGGDGP